jgi:uncharacterized protein (DUF3084 family)
VTWWAWTLLWVVLVAASLGVFFLIARSLWRSAVALMDELGTAADRLSAVRDEMETLQAAAAQEDLAVFADPTQLRQERILAARRGTSPRMGSRH